MSRYVFRHEQLGPWPVVALVDSDMGMSVRVAHRGATVLDFRVPVGGGLRDIADGFRTPEELEALEGARFGILLPFANRIADARYRFRDEDFDLQPGAVGADRGIMHGFVRGADFELLAVDAADEGVCARFGYRGLRPGVHPGYPFALDLEVTYTLHAGGLDLDAGMRNVSERAAPCFFGWHPYFRLHDDGIDGCELTLPARQAIRTDDAMIPLPGPAALRSLDRCPELDFRRRRRIGDQVMDNGFADPVADADGRVRSHLGDPDSGLAIAMWQERGVTLVFTGDTLRHRTRQSVALEPMEAMTNAFNRADAVDAITLDAGAERHFRCGIQLRPAGAR